MSANPRAPIAALALVLFWCGPAAAIERCLYVGDAFFDKGRVRTSRSLISGLAEDHRGPNLFCVSAYDTRGRTKGNVRATITIHQTDGSRLTTFLSGKPEPDGLGGNVFFDCVVAFFDLEEGSLLQCDIRVRGYKLEHGEQARLECLLFPEASLPELASSSKWVVRSPE